MGIQSPSPEEVLSSYDDGDESIVSVSSEEVEFPMEESMQQELLSEDIFAEIYNHVFASEYIRSLSSKPFVAASPMSFPLIPDKFTFFVKVCDLQLRAIPSRSLGVIAQWCSPCLFKAINTFLDCSRFFGLSLGNLVSFLV